ncbi:hypothetical protein [Martelella alba]|uniref:Uncharacterized protein n=1 Tax=Martelella alba TaxID=2590451 RepID=A0ABY2SDV1_9HYPH|nr:hypothetical protein [Martelella alba]TKI02777.1 hypothetical protein FCN80_24070 [Martelella alba]
MNDFIIKYEEISICFQLQDGAYIASITDTSGNEIDEPVGDIDFDTFLATLAAKTGMTEDYLRETISKHYP